jgi:single-stranded DNA-binding protein
MHRNEVVLAGCLAEAPDERVLPSGDRMVTWRVTVRRPLDGRSGTRVDSIPCVTFDPELRGLVEGWRRQDFVEVRGVVRRRFWRTREGGSGSRVEVEARTARKLDPAQPELDAAQPDLGPARPDETPPAEPRPLQSLLGPIPATPTPKPDTPHEAPPNGPHPEGDPPRTHAPNRREADAPDAPLPDAPPLGGDGGAGYGVAKVGAGGG